jgi:signal transduction histidine kinase
MKYKSPLSNRIIISFVLLTTVVSGLFSFGIMTSIDMVEEDLITAELNRKFRSILVDYRHGELPHLDLGTKFYSGTENLPYYLRDLKPGLSEVELERSAFHVMVQQEKEETPFYLVQERTDTERQKSKLGGIVIAGFFLSVAASLILGMMMARRIVAPVRRLTNQVHNREKLLLDAPPLSPGYDDEMGHLAQAFDRTINMLQQALQRETLFTSDVSHELRTPLMVINSSCDLLIEKNQLDDYTRQRIGIISRACREIQELVDTFLTLARGKETNQECATLADIIHANLGEWQKQSAAKGLIFTLTLENKEKESHEEVYPVPMLRTVLNNLVRNAIHHTSTGSITLRQLSAGFEICDTGQGISEADKESIFKLFYRGKSSSNHSLGLGLSLVQRICEREQWEISVKDNHPLGSCFTVSL